MTPAPFQCPACGSYDVEWLNDVQIHCLDCGKVFSYPPGALKFLRGKEDLEDCDNSNGENHITWNGARASLEEE